MRDVTVDTQEIDNLGTWFTGRVALVKPHSDSLTGLAVVPGQFDDGTAVKIHIETRITNLKTVLVNVQGAFDHVGKALSDISVAYTGTEDDSKILGNELKNLVTQLGKDFKGITVK